jgi:membrane-associated phospholipid phosphatase
MATHDNAMRSLRVAGVLVLGWAVWLVVMLALGWLVTHVLAGTWLGGADLAVDAWLVDHRTGPLDPASAIATGLCSTTNVFVIGSVAAAVASLLLRRWWPLLLLAVALVGEFVMFFTTAILTERPRPPVAHLDAALPPTSSFPSGHTAAAICLFGAIAVIVCRATRAWWRYLVVAAAVILVLAVAGSRIYRGAHYPTDDLGAVVLAVPWLLLCARLLARPVGSTR